MSHFTISYYNQSDLDISDKLRGKTFVTYHHDVKMIILHVQQVLRVVIAKWQPATNGKTTARHHWNINSLSYVKKSFL